MVAICKVCGAEKVPGRTDVTSHSIPVVNGVQNQTWVEILRSLGKECSKTTTICSDHFEDQFYSYSGKRKILVGEAIPTLLPNIYFKIEPVQLQSVFNQPQISLPLDVCPQSDEIYNLPCDIESFESTSDELPMELEKEPLLSQIASLCPYDLKIDMSKPKIRVLSLFDGIGTGFQVLKELGLDVDVYYASEVDPKAILVANEHHASDGLQQIGDVINIDETKLRAMGRIDLLLCGSPCDELSALNPKRKGVNDKEGTGPLLLEGGRIQKLMEEISKERKENRELYWCYENVSSMTVDDEKTITKKLGRKPIFSDAIEVSAQSRKRFFWSNILQLPCKTRNVVLQEALAKNHNRVAQVEQINTITTNRANIRGKGNTRTIVLHDGEPSPLWITEIEVIFGLSKHYTNVANLSVTDKGRLLGRAWSVPQVARVLKALKYVFKAKEAKA